MLTMKRETLRSIVTWLLLAGAILAVFISGQWINEIAQLYGSAYPASAWFPAKVPTFISVVLPLIDFIMFLSWIVLVAAGISVAAACKLVDERPTREHVIALISAVIYHMVFMAWAVFAMAYFYMPKLRVGV